MKKLNIVAGAHGYGRVLYFEDTTVGIKGIQAFEAPGLLFLIETHRALERAVLTRRQLAIKFFLEKAYADLLFRGMLYEPVMRDIKAFIDSTQQIVNGSVRMKLDIKNAFPVGIYSPHLLLRKEIAEYGQRASWAGSEAEAFIKLFSLDKRFDRVEEKFKQNDEKFNKIEATLIAVVEDLKEARKERQNLERRINETYNTVDGFIKVVDKLETEFTVVKEDLKRIKQVIKEKLGIDLF